MLSETEQSRLRNRFRRLFWCPLENHFPSVIEEATLKHAADVSVARLMEFGSSIESDYEYGSAFSKTLHIIFIRLCQLVRIDGAIMNEVFQRENVEFRAYFEEQIALEAVRRGWVLAISEDKLACGKTVYSWISPRDVPFYPSDEAAEFQLWTPFEVRLSAPISITKAWCRSIAAENIWFVLITPAFNFVAPQQREVVSQESVPADAWEALLVEDEHWKGLRPNSAFVRHAVREVMCGHHGTGHAAAVELVRAKGFAKPRQDGKVFAGSKNAAEEAIYKPANKILKRLKENGLHPKFS